jgi:antitoxin (DNA-binding transcriptional repressor) of toxin-antitoxin stability system
MRSVGLKVLKNKLSEYVRLAAGGETILVTDRDHVVAELGPPHRERVSAETWWAEQVRNGVIEPARVAPGAPPPRGKPVMRFDELVDEIGRDRDDR